MNNVETNKQIVMLFKYIISYAVFKNGLYRIHDEEIADYSEDSLASDFFEEWWLRENI